MRGLDKNKELFKQLVQGGLIKILGVIKENKLEYYLGIRNECIDLYYMGGRILEIKCINNNFQFKFDLEYIPEKDKIEIKDLVTKFSVNNTTALSKWVDVIPKIKDNIAEFQKGYKDGGKAKVKNEKIAQQEILINNNLSSESDFFITDMEYSIENFKFGRFDYIAISKNVDNQGKHKLALIELKYDTGSFEGTKIYPYGSGIVGHVCNFNRFVFGENGDGNRVNVFAIKGKELDTVEQLKRETLNIISNYSDLGLDKIYPEIIKIQELTEADISDEIETLILVVGCKNEKGSRVDTATTSLKKYLGVNSGKNARINVKNTLFKEDRLNITLKCYIVEGIPKYLQFNFFKELK